MMARYLAATVPVLAPARGNGKGTTGTYEHGHATDEPRVLVESLPQLGQWLEATPALPVQ